MIMACANLILRLLCVVCLFMTARGTMTPRWQPFECKVTARIGCFADAGEHVDKHKRVLEEQVENAKSLEDCAFHCAAHGFGDETFKGVEYGSQCYCGHRLRGNPAKQPDSDCSMPCKVTNERNVWR